MNDESNTKVRDPLPTADEIRAHYAGKKMTRAELLEQLVRTEMRADRLNRDLCESVENVGALRGVAANNIEDARQANTKARDAEKVADGRIAEMQMRVEASRAGLEAADHRADWYKEQRDRLAGIIEGMRGDCLDKGKRRRFDKVLASLTAGPITAMSDRAVDNIREDLVMQHDGEKWGRGL